MLTKRRIEQESDGYIRDLLRKKKKNQSIFITINAVVLGFFILISAIFAFAAFKPLPTELESGTYVFEEHRTRRNPRGKHGSNITDLFVSTNGDEFAIKFDEAVDKFEKGRTYDITYYVGFLYSFIYTATDGENVIISEEDHIKLREENIKDFPKDILITFCISLGLALIMNLPFILLTYRGTKEIDQKINRRREKRGPDHNAD